MLSTEAIREFKEIFHREYGQEITDQMALEMANNLINLLKIIYKPIPTGGQNGQRQP